MPRRVSAACLVTLLASPPALAAPGARAQEPVTAKPPAAVSDAPAAPADAPPGPPGPPGTPAPPAPPAGAASSPPPAAPAQSSTPPSRPPAEDSSPRTALKLLAVALRDGDADRIRLVMHAATPAESRMVSAMADMARAMATLQAAAVKAFGRDAAKEVVGDTDATDAESKARIDAADVKVHGDTATVIMEDGEEAPVVLKRVDGRWKLPMAELAKGADAAALEERLSALADQSRLVRTLAGEIESGKYATPAQAHEAWQSRAMQASMRKPTGEARKPDARKPDTRKPDAKKPDPKGAPGAAPRDRR